VCKDKKTALEDRGVDGAKRYSPSAARNRDVIRDVLVKYLPDTGTILEVGAGTGEHAAHFAQSLPGVRWLPGDPDPASRASIAAWAGDLKIANIAQPHAIDVCTEDWSLSEDLPLSGIVSLNMIHIAPFAALKGLAAGAGRYLRKNGVFFLYGPFSRNGRHTAASNEAFDQSLKSRDPCWGVRDLEADIIPLVNAAGLRLYAVEAMPANNFSVVFTKNA